MVVVESLATERSVILVEINKFYFLGSGVRVLCILNIMVFRIAKQQTLVKLGADERVRIIVYGKNKYFPFRIRELFLCVLFLRNYYLQHVPNYF